MTGRLRSLLKGRGATIEKATFAATAEKLRRQGQLPEAVDLCREGLRSYPDQLSARVTLGRALMDLGEYDEARIELEYVMKRAPDNLAAIRGLAQLHDKAESAAVLTMEQVGDWPPRQEDIDKAIQEHAGVTNTLHAAAARATDTLEPSHVDVADQTGPDAPSAQVDSPADAIPEATFELLEEAEALEAIADRDPAEREPGTLQLDETDEVDLEEIASELVVPEGATKSPAAADGQAESANQGGQAPMTAEETIVLDAEAIDGDLEHLVGLDAALEDHPGQAAAGSAEHEGVQTPRHGDGRVSTESALDALERLLDQVKHRRDELTSDSAA
jgi:tetratricopeptide (TPR) repeat protein